MASPLLVLMVATVAEEIAQAFKTVGELIGVKEAVRGVVGTAVMEFSPLAEWSLNAIRAFWQSTRNTRTVSGLRVVDPVRAIKEAVKVTALLQAAGVDAEFVTETAEEAFSEALMPGIAGAMRAEAAIRMGFEPWTQPHQILSPYASGMVDQLTGIYWPNLVHLKLEQAYNDIARFWQKYSDAIEAAEAYSVPHALLAGTKALPMAVSQVYQNIMDAINALYTRVTEMLTIYLGAKSLYDNQLIGKEELYNAQLQLISTLQSIIDNIKMLEQEIDMMVDMLEPDANKYDDILSWVDNITGAYIENNVAKQLSEWWEALWQGRIWRPYGGIRMYYVYGDRPREYDILAG